ncbi:lytic transglycosylase domain-containing protein [Desulfopila sp. IMCC35006]|uniref:lytic transglycosylase domain-containing protein n=1 Tax=Desulfopila sp. IMCC35006 TaxID=2569542 RepID=UPI0010AC01F7|nr:lytic transglycosylase domain-containing protein [Desulfopila sp. IMCC35006]TKB23468.1 lytic transglycosylase domain-containing protein [Desulfopila sp. IMCC35006]
MMASLITTLALSCAPAIDAPTLSAIVKTESNYNHLAIGINGNKKLARQPQNEAEAISTARWLIGHNYSVDMGLGQINSANLETVGLTVDEIFDPCNNIAAAAKIFNSNYVLAKRNTSDNRRAFLQAISAYNTGSFTKGFENGYVQKIISAIPPIPLKEKSLHNKNEILQTVQITEERNYEKNELSVYEDQEIDGKETNVYSDSDSKSTVY